MISHDFKEILDKYTNEKVKDYKSSSFALNFRKKLPKTISKLINNENFIVKASCGYINWAKYPWISIKHKSFDSSNESLFIYYIFNVESSSISLFIRPKLEEYGDYISVKDILFDKLKSYDVEDFKICNDNDSFILLSKNYNYDEFDDSILKNDLNKIIRIYNKLSDVLRNFFDNSSIEVKEYNFIFEDSIFSDENIISPTDTLFRRERVIFSENKSKVNIADIKTENIVKNIYPNEINNVEEFFTDELINKIIKCDITPNDYNDILIDIKFNSMESLLSIIRMNNINLFELPIKDKILLYSKSFTSTEYKSIGKLLGSYSFNKIQIDDRLPNPLIITSIIHELSHFLLEKILKEVLMKILNTNDTPLISSYVKILLEDNDLNYLLDEFCAHTVEGRFALYGFQDYSSFKYKLNEISHLYSKEDIDYALILANTFAYDIKDILENFIDEMLREQIKEEFLKLNEEPKYDALDFEIESKIENNYFIESLALILTSGIGEAVNQIDKLERYMDKFESY